VPPAELERLEKVAEEYNLEKLTDANTSSIVSMMRLSEGIAALKEALTPAIMERIMQLKGTALGFLTDEATRKKGPYTVEETKSAVIEAILQGMRVVGNEFNIISARCYAAKNGIVRVLREKPGFSDKKIIMEVPTMKPNGATVRYRACWKLNGVPNEMSGELPIRVNEYMGADAVLGKAERKINFQILKEICGSKQTGIQEGEVEDAIPAAFEIKPPLEAPQQQAAIPAPAAPVDPLAPGKHGQKMKVPAIASPTSKEEQVTKPPEVIPTVEQSAATADGSESAPAAEGKGLF
jgi:hypothetical protein